MLFTSREREKKELPINRTWSEPPSPVALDRLTLAYITCREDCRIEWWYESVLRQTDGKPPKIIVVDFYRDQRDVTQGIWRRIREETTHVMVKPNVFCGPHRVTSRNYFAASNFRNTAALLCSTEWLCLCDDLSVPFPAWIQAIKEAMVGGYIALGAYRKVLKLVVENGLVKSFEDSPGGHDCRWDYGYANRPTPCHGDWMFGCSFALPIEAIIKVNGFPEDTNDGLSYDDIIVGRLIEKHGYKFFYDRRMTTYESEELHGKGEVFLRTDPCPEGKDRSHDKSHAMLRMLNARSDFPNVWGADGFRGERERVLSTGQFPLKGEPVYDWFDGSKWSDK